MRHLSELYLEVIVRLLQAGDVLGDWETHVRGFGVSDKMPGTTHLKKGLRKGQWAAKVTGRTEHLSLPCAQVLVQAVPDLCPNGQQRQRLTSSNSFREKSSNPGIGIHSSPD